MDGLYSQEQNQCYLCVKLMFQYLVCWKYCTYQIMLLRRANGLIYRNFQIDQENENPNSQIPQISEQCESFDLVGEITDRNINIEF